MVENSPTIEQTCPFHSKIVIGICLELECDSSELLCEDCFAASCCQTKGCRIESLDNALSSIIESGECEFDIANFNNTLEQASKIDFDLLSADISAFTVAKCKQVNDLVNYLASSLETVFSTFTNKVNNKIETLELALSKSAENLSELERLEIPTELTAEKIYQTLLKSENDQLKVESTIELIKKYSEKSRMKIFKDEMENIILINSLSSLKPKNKKKNQFDKFSISIKTFLDAVLAKMSHLVPKRSFFLGGRTFMKTKLTGLQEFALITDKGQKSYTIDNMFACFKPNGSNDNYIVYPCGQILEVYNLTTDNKEQPLEGHQGYIYSVRHYFCKLKAIDYLISSSYDKTVCVWNFNNVQPLLLKINTQHVTNYLYTCLLYQSLTSKTLNIATCSTNDTIKIWDLEGIHINTFGKKNEFVYYLQDFISIDGLNQYMIVANSQDVKVFDLSNFEQYRSFTSSKPSWHMSAYQYNLNGQQFLIATNGNGFIKEWNVHTGELVREMQIKSTNLRGFTFWNPITLVVASSDKSIKIVDFENLTEIASVVAHNNVVCSIEKLSDNLKGELIVSASIDGKIKVWKPI